MMSIPSKNDRVRQIVATIPNFPDQIDAIATVSGWFRPGHGPHWPTGRVIDSYLTESITVQEAVTQLATPIEEAYIAALRGKRDNSDTSTECGLWDLYYGILHAAKKSHWDSTSSRDQDKLLQLVQALKARPDPISPDHVLSYGLARNWVFSGRCLWSKLTLLGPSARETWNDSPGCGAGCSEPEVQAWCNVNAFVARLSATDTAHFWNYGIWALRDAVEGGSCGTTGHVDDQGVRIDMRVALVWLRVVGKEMWQRSCDGSALLEHEVEVPLDVDVSGKKCPWALDGAPEYSWSRWDYWRRRFRLVSVSKNRKWNEATKQLALEAAIFMEQIEKEDDASHCGSGDVCSNVDGLH